MSAQACCTAWNDPIGLPNCLRTFAYATVASSIASISPRLSQAIATAGPVQQPAGGSFRVVGEPQHAALGPVRADGREPPGLIDHRLRLDAQPGRPWRYIDNHRLAVWVAGQDQHPGRRRRIRSELGPPRQPGFIHPERTRSRSYHGNRHRFPSCRLAEQVIAPGGWLQGQQGAHAEHPGPEVLGPGGAPAHFPQDDGDLGEGNARACVARQSAGTCAAHRSSVEVRASRKHHWAMSA